MSLESTILSFVFNIDNWSKKPLIDLRGKFPQVKDEYDIVFCDENPDLLKADLHYPMSYEGKIPVLLNIHGGGWIIGDKSNSTSYCLQIANRGFFVMNINYGMPEKDVPSMFESVDPVKNHSAEWTWPYPIQTHFKAMKWLEANADKYNLDLTNVFVSGDSAGSHMTGVVCACFCDDDYASRLGVEKPSFTPKGYIMNCGLYRLSIYEKIPIGRCMMQKFTGLKDIRQHPLYKEINPIPYINKKANNVLVVKGFSDIMTIFQSDWMYKKLQKEGVPSELYVGRGFPLSSFHDFMFLTFTSQAKECMAHTEDWLLATVAKK